MMKTALEMSVWILLAAPSPIIVNSVGSWSIATRTQLKDPARFRAGQVITDPQDCNNVLGFLDTERVTSGTLSLAGFVHLQPNNTLCLTYSSFGNPGQSIGPVGQSGILRRIVISAPFRQLRERSAFDASGQGGLLTVPTRQYSFQPRGFGR